VSIGGFTKVKALKNWEQGHAKPNAQTFLLIRMAAPFPGLAQPLATIGISQAFPSKWILSNYRPSFYAR
jgi:hypothetical protein